METTVRVQITKIMISVTTVKMTVKTREVAMA